MKTRCPTCGKRNDGAFCIICGTPAPTTATQDNASVKRNIITWFLALDATRKAWVVGGLSLALLLLVLFIIPQHKPAHVVEVIRPDNSKPGISKSAHGSANPVFTDKPSLTNTSNLGSQGATPQDQIASIRAAADRGDAAAQNKLGVLYENGRGVPADYSQAIVLYRLSAEQGNADAEYNLARLYDRGFMGLDVEEATGQLDYAQAFYWYRLAAEQGHAYAQARLGNMYFLSLGVPLMQANYALAIYWCRKAADQGNAYAETSLAGFYSSPNAVGYAAAPDYAQAALWYRRAAEQGDPGGQYNLGVFYQGGRGVPQNFAEAYFWIELYAIRRVNQGTADVEAPLLKRKLDDVGSHLTPAELAQVQERVQKWLEEHPQK